MIIPSIDLMSGQAVQLIGGEAKAIEAGDPRPIAERFARVGDIAVIDLDAALGQGDNRALIEELVVTAPCRVGGGIRDLATAERWLTAGATQVILGTAAVPEILSRLPRERVMAALDAKDGEIVVKGWRERTGVQVERRLDELKELVGGFLLTFVEREGRMVGMDLDRVRMLVERAAPARVTVAGGIKNAGEVAAVDRAGADAQVGMALYTGQLDLASVLTAIVHDDAQAEGPWRYVLCEDGGRTGGRGTIDRKGLARALETGRITHAGAESRLCRIEPDAARESLNFVVAAGEALS